MIGQLFGGTASCSSITDDNYGRLDVSWDAGGAPNNQAKDWLDPGNTGIKVVDGMGTGACAGIVFDDDASLATIDGIDPLYCGGGAFTPTLTVRNAGANPLTSVTINWDFNGTTGSMNWTGNLTTGQTDMVTLAGMQAAPGSNSFQAWTSDPNGVADQNTNNDSKDRDFVYFDDPITLSLELNFDNFPGETSWQIELANGTIVAQGGGYAGTNATESICLDGNGCYTFIINDTYGDGMCCTYGQGSYALLRGNDTIASGGEFQDSEETDFCTGSVGVNELAELAGVSIYPNPSNGQISINLSKVQSDDVSVRIFNVVGAVIVDENVSSKGNIINYDLSGQPAGMYMVQVRTAEAAAVKRIAIQK